MKPTTSRHLALAALCAAALSLSACTTTSKTPNSFADQLRNTGDANAQDFKVWEAGNRSVEKGNKQIERGEALVVKGEKNVQRSQELIETGETQAVAQNEAYRRATRRIGSAKTPQLAMDESKTLKEIAKKWQDALDQQEEGRKLLKDGEQQIADGRTMRRSGETMVAEGNDQMKQIEDDYREIRPLIPESAPELADARD